MNELQGKVGVVTGGSSGIGLAIAQRLHRHGAKISIFSRNANRAASHAALAVSGDVTKISDLDHLYRETKNKLGMIDILIANAGIAETRHVSEVDEKFFDETVNTNYKGLYFTIQRSLPFLNPGASIVIISSAVAHMTWPEHSVYASTKAAASSLTKSFASDLIGRKIRVNALSPGFVATPMFDGTPADVMEKFHSNIPIRRFATPEEIADGAYLLCTCQAMTGSDLVIDGGLSTIRNSSG
ncbi:MAG: SDR family oxidoreductase [Verrucomicrobia bacterium]|nr:SDR family oxidoreductase [Verrucomicrobiota bacterium]